jgi:DNA-binding MurR/RpiR family transcriptional regulator
MELQKPQFTPNDLLIYETILKNPTYVVHMTTKRLAVACGVSQPALSRFVKTLGYNRYQDFRAAFITYLAQQTESEQKQSNRLPYFNTLFQVLQEAEAMLTEPYMQELAQYINSFERVFALGEGKSYEPAQLLEALMRKYRRHIHAVHFDYLTSLVDSMDERDLLIIFSVSAASYIQQDAAYRSGKLLLVTANPNHGMEQIADKVIVLPFIPPDPETSSVSPVLFDVFVELLVSYLAE